MTVVKDPTDWVDVAIGEAILRCDHAGRIVEVRGLLALLPLPADRLVGQRIADIDSLPPALRGAWTSALERTVDTQRAQICVYSLATGDGPRSFEARMLPLEGGHVAIAIRDVTERDHLREQIEHAASYDALTGLPNRRGLRDALGSALRPGRTVALFLVDLDRFKQGNDLLGATVGDSLLRLVGQRLAREAAGEAAGRPYEPLDVRVAEAVDGDHAVMRVARVGGDQFAIVWRIDDLPSRAERIDAFAARLITAVGAPTRLGGQTLFVRASVGSAVFPADASTPSALFSQADGALMRAKQGGRNQHRRHGDAVAGTKPATPHGEDALREALACDRFELVYQPKFELASSITEAAVDARDRSDLAPGAMIAVEALVRWRVAAGALLIPHQFIPLAESSGVIRPLGDWVLRQALAEVGQFAERGAVRVGVSINVSLLQLHDRTFVHAVEAALKDHGFEPRELTIEIAETAFLDDIRLVADTVAELSALGVRLAIDHFGVGTAGLVALKSLPIDEIKIDRSFVAGAAIDAFDATIVAGLIEMAHNLGMTVTAEGVERVDQIASLSQMRCDAIQGYFVGEPMSADALIGTPRLWQKTRSGS